MQEKSPAFVTARSSAVAMANFNRELKRNTLPVLPPAPGFEGDVEYMRQVELWKHWIQWEKSDPLVIKEEDPTTYKNRIVYVYKHALMALRFWPEIWYDAADFCFDNAIKDANGKEQGTIFLEQGIAANPESLLLAFKQADSIEISMANESGDDALKRRGDAVRAPYNKVLDALYALVKKTDARKNQDIARVKELAEQEADDEVDMMKDEDDDDDDQPNGHTSRRKEEVLKMRIDAIQYGAKAQVDLTKKLITSAWVALMRAMRRIQGKGKIGDPVGGSRQVFADARKRGWITSEVYIASALMEYHSYKDPAATKILEKGVKLYPEDEHFALEYLKHLIAINDVTSKYSCLVLGCFLFANHPVRRPSSLRDDSQPTRVETRDTGQSQASLRLLSRVRVTVRRTQPSHQTREAYGRSLAFRTSNRTLRAPLLSPNLRSDVCTTNYLPCHASKTQDSLHDPEYRKTVVCHTLPTASDCSSHADKLAQAPVHAR